MRMKSPKALDLILSSLWSYLFSYLGRRVTDPAFCFLMNDDDDDDENADTT